MLSISVNAGLPNIIGALGAAYGGLYADDSITNNAFVNTGRDKYAYATHESGKFNRYVSMDASRSSSIYGNSGTVTPESLTILVILKY